MTPEQFRRAEELYFEAKKLPPEEQQRFLDSACADDREVHDEVGRLLAQPAATLAMKPVPKGDGSIARDDTEYGAGPPAAERIGRYRIVCRIGEGGMGEVYEAEQEQPMRRTVALKVIKLGMDTRSIVARFEAERQALAMMDHPNIASVFDAGATEQGQPYFVMEYVRGTRITDYCDEHRLTIPERLDLFMQLCQAIQHAHQKGIVHRDIKPSNVLVAIHDDKPVPKVIDFGVARATDRRLTEGTVFTQEGQLVGTPEYMSPEQAEMSGLDIDTRTDIYSLGVLLYELLVGALPYGRTYLKGRGFVEIQRIILEEEPLKPSTRLRDLGPDSTTFAEKRRTDPNSLRRQLRGDLDWITMKALEKDRDRRYASASGLAADIRCYLKHERVSVGPPSAIYRIRKFVRRNRALVASAAVVFVVLVAGIVASTMFAVGERRARREVQWQAYVANIRAAAGALFMNEIATVRRCLAIAPAEFRNWEWRYLNAAADQSLATLRGHEDGVMSVMFSPDGSRLVSAGRDHTVRIWEVTTGKELATLKRHDSEVYSAVFNPDGKRVASGSGDRTIKIWDVTGGGEPLTLSGHGGSVWWVTFSPDGKRLASASTDDTACLWDADSGEKLAVLGGHGDEVSCVAFNPNGTRLASASYDRTLAIWDASTGQKLAILDGHEGGVASVAWSPDGTRLASTSHDKTVRIWDADTGDELACLRGHGDPTSSAAFSPDNTRLASASWDRTVRLWNVSTGDELAVLRGHESPVWWVAFSPEGTLLASASLDKTVRLWDASADAAPAVLPGHKGNVGCVAFSPDGTRLASGSDDNTVRIWDPLSGDELAVLALHEDLVRCVAFSPDGTRLASASDDNTVRIWDVYTGEELAILQRCQEAVMFVVFSPDGTRLAWASRDNTVRIWDTYTGEELAARGHECGVQSVAFNPDGACLASASGDDVRISRTQTGEVLATLQEHEKSVQSVVFSPDGACLASGSEDETARLWDAITGEELAVLHGHEDNVECVAFAPDSARLASASLDETVRIWDVSTGEELIVLRGHEDGVNSVAFSPDGTRLASAANDRTILLWDTVPYRFRYEERQVVLAARPEVERIVDALWRELNDPKRVAQRLREDASLSAPVRRAALNLVLRRAAGGREARQ